MPVVYLTRLRDANLMDADGNVVGTRTWSWTGQTLRPEELQKEGD